MSKSKVRLVGEDIDISEIDLRALTTDCHGVSYSINELAATDVVRAHCMVDIFDLYHDEGKTVDRIWVLGGTLNPKLTSPEIVIKQ